MEKKEQLYEGKAKKFSPRMTRMWSWFPIKMMPPLLTA